MSFLNDVGVLKQKDKMRMIDVNTKQKVCDLFAQGLSQRAIARQLSISRATVANILLQQELCRRGFGRTPAQKDNQSGQDNRLSQNNQPPYMPSLHEIWKVATVEIRRRRGLAVPDDEGD